jgi:hypothetical protein
LVVLPLLASVVVIVWAAPGSAPFRAAVTAIIVVVAVVLLLRPSLFRALPFKSVSLPGGFSYELFDRSIAEEEPDETSGASGASLLAAGDMADRWLAVRWKLERKLTYLAKHTLPDHLPLIDAKSAAQGDARPFLTAGSLVEDGLLDVEEATVLTYTLALSSADLETVNRVDLEQLLGAAERLAHVIRARVFQKLVAKFIDARPDWTVSERNGLRWIMAVGQSSITIVPAFGPRNGELVAQQVARLTLDQVERGVVVVPCYPGTTPMQIDDATGPLVVRLDQLDEAVAHVTARGA